MYDSLFCRMYNEFGWNEYPRVFGGKLLEWLRREDRTVKTALDLGCGTGVLCEVLHEQGIETLGVDLSGNMIEIARQRSPGLRYEVGDMTAFRPSRAFDLVTCTGDALNHVTELSDVGRVFQNVWFALNPGGVFVFDLLKADEVPDGAPFEARFTDNLTVRFAADVDDKGFTTLRIDAFEGEIPKFSEVIREKLHDVETILSMLRQAGFTVLQCADRLLTGDDHRGTTWFVCAEKGR